MNPHTLYGVVKLVSLLILALLAAAVLYGGWQAVALWTGIGV